MLFGAPVVAVHPPGSAGGAFPAAPSPALARRMPPARAQRESTRPSAEVPSTRHMVPLHEPLYTEPPPTVGARLMPSALGYDAPLFNCQCMPKCIDFVKPRDHTELHWIGSATQPLRTRVIAAGPTGHGRQPSRTQTADFDVDCRVAYEFNDVGFYDELLRSLDSNYTELLVANDRSQAFLHRARTKCPEDAAGGVPRSYVPYYPTRQLPSHVAHAPLKDARNVAASVIAPVVGSTNLAQRLRDKEQAFRDDLNAQAAQAIAAAAESAAAAAASSSASPPVARALSESRSRLTAEREKFQAEMQRALLEKMTITASRAASAAASKANTPPAPSESPQAIE